MPHHKRKKQKRQPYVGYRRVYERHRDKDGDKVSAMSSKRSKSKRVVIQAKKNDGQPSWFLGTKDWFTWGRYEKLKDAKAALTVLRKKRFPGASYDLRIVDERK